MKFKTLLAVSALSSVLPTVAQAGDRPEGCYQPVSGFATSVCTADQCATQAGVYRLVLRSDSYDQDDSLELSGVFTGSVIGTGTDEVTGAPTTVVEHMLSDAKTGAQILTGPDIGVVVGGDGVTYLELVETITVRAGTGAFAGLQAGGQITLEGRLDLVAGVNSLKVAANQGDNQLCFSKR